MQADTKICLVNDSGNSCPLVWKSKTLRRVVRSTLAAETTAMVDALDASYFVSHMLSEILFHGYNACPSNRVNVST